VTDQAIKFLPDDGAVELARMPHPPGLGPFRIKGVAYRGHLEYVKDHVPGGVEAMFAALGATTLRSFFEQPFLPSVMYDVRPLALAGMACAVVTGREYLDFVALRTRQQARDDIRGVYKFLLKFVSMDVIASRAPTLMGQYFDFASIATNKLEASTYRATIAGLPAPLAPWFVTCMQAYIDEVAHIAANLEMRTRTIAAKHAGSKDGVAMVDVEYVVEAVPASR
jgi:hypothetical protein